MGTGRGSKQPAHAGSSGHSPAASAAALQSCSLHGREEAALCPQQVLHKLLGAVLPQGATTVAAAAAVAGTGSCFPLAAGSSGSVHVHASEPQCCNFHGCQLERAASWLPTRACCDGAPQDARRALHLTVNMLRNAVSTVPRAAKLLPPMAAAAPNVSCFCAGYRAAGGASRSKPGVQHWAPAISRPRGPPSAPGAQRQAASARASSALAGVMVTSLRPWVALVKGGGAS